MEQTAIDHYNTDEIKYEPDWTDTDHEPTPPIYTTSTVDVRQVAADRVSFSSHQLLDSGVPVRIANRLENGVAARVTVTVVRNATNPTNVYLFASDEHVPSSGLATPPMMGALLGSTDPASNAPGTLTLSTCGEIYAACAPNSGTGAFVSVVVENFHGMDPGN
jgi:hypothetical protein